MITRIITNHIKEGHKAEYVKASKAFCAALVEKNGCLEARVYEVEGSETTVLNFERWPDKETAEAVTGTETFREFVPLLVPHFEGNEELVLNEA